MGESGGAPDGKGKSRLTSKKRFSCGGAGDKRSFERLHKEENSVKKFFKDFFRRTLMGVARMAGFGEDYRGFGETIGSRSAISGLILRFLCNHILHLHFA
ncbi:hypothetical protein H0G86_000445 [Trichoderma simmonsii]|uniref:Uncharacterized protein n=1 Tax=Trichoderma simmonsii TaxID=1491479 RepID=A0A8G0L4L7_9HYPO|nr:hypothetical protein H0G86_000445 [Trichoderma simmonsii]